MRWQVPVMFSAPTASASVREVADAFLTSVAHGPLATLTPPKRWLRGAVYDSSARLVKESQKIGGLNGHNWVPADAGSLTGIPANAERLEGTWLYGGHWMQHFGHFAIETISTMWPRAAVDGLVFHKYHKRPWALEAWQQQLIDLAGYGDLPIRCVGGRRGLRVEKLVVPTRSVVVNGWVLPEAVQVWNRVAGAAGAAASGGASPRIYVSRTGHNAAARAAGHRRVRTTPEHDRTLDLVFADADFRVVRPEELSVDEQIRIVSGAEILGGGAGSALHLSAFAPASTRVIEVGDPRSPQRSVPLQRLIDAARSHEHLFVPGGLGAAEMATGLRRALSDNGTLGRRASLRGLWRP